MAKRKPLCRLLIATFFLQCATARRPGRRTHEDCGNSADCLGLPGPSFLDPWKEDIYGPDYWAFNNVKLVDEALIFYRGEASAGHSAADVPMSIPLNKDELELPLSVRQVPYTADSQCQKMQTEPAVLIAGTPWDDNLYEMMCNDVMPLWATAKEAGLLDADRYLKTHQTPQSSNESFILIQAREAAYETNWSYLFKYMTPTQLLLKQVNNTCFSKLLVVSDSILRYLLTREFDDPAHKQYYDSKQQKLFQGFQHWMFQVEGIHQRSLGIPKPGKLTDSAPYERPRILLSSRPIPRDKTYQSRGIDNEAEVVEFIEEQYDVNVTVVNFSSALEPSMELVRSSSMLFGMHGAGLTHSLWMRPGSHFMQLAPFGFTLTEEHLIRGDYFRDIAHTASCTYSSWVNPHAHLANFHEDHFYEDGLDGGFFPHPNETTPMPTDWKPPHYWIYQSTVIDLQSFGEALDHAMTLLHIPKKLLV